MLSGIVFVKQKLDVTFNSDNQDAIEFTKFLKLTICRASEAESYVKVVLYLLFFEQ